LLLATFGLYSSLGAPLAIAIALMLLAGVTAPPANLDELRVEHAVACKEELGGSPNSKESR
jgi:uncharacterized membrane protein YdfJ with MMPL/SSD domain